MYFIKCLCGRLHFSISSPTLLGGYTFFTDLRQCFIVVDVALTDKVTYLICLNYLSTVLVKIKNQKHVRLDIGNNINRYDISI